LTACQNNTSGDVELAESVIEKCEKSFFLALKSDRRRAYEKAQRVSFAIDVARTLSAARSSTHIPQAK